MLIVPSLDWTRDVETHAMFELGKFGLSHLHEVRAWPSGMISKFHVEGMRALMVLRARYEIPPYDCMRTDSKGCQRLIPRRLKSRYLLRLDPA